MPPLERVGLEAVFDTKEFQRGQRIYERGLARVDSTTAKTARKLTAAWGDSTAGLEDMFTRLDAARGQTEEMAASLASMGDETAAVATGMSAMSAAAIGVSIGLAAIAAAGVALWSKIGDAAMEYLARSEEVIKAQDRVNEEWDQASRHLAQTLIPLKVELLEVELRIAKAVNASADFFTKWVAIIHSGLAAIVAALGVLPEAIEEAIEGDIPSMEEVWERMAEAGGEALDEVMDAYEDAAKETFPEIEEAAEDNWEQIADAINRALERIEDMQIAHNRRLTDLADDYRIKQERAWAKYGQAVAKEIARGQARIAKLEETYGKRRAKTIADYQKRIAKAEASASEARVKAQEDYDRRERHARERFHLDSIQSERRYQFERNRLVAEGDTLAIEELDARYKLEQGEQAENEALRQRQTREGQTEQIREAGEAAREQIDELRQQLAETLTEQETNYLDQIERQKQANRDRIDEMAVSFADQQRMADEDYQRSIEKADLNYQRQQEDLGRNLARQEELQELGGEEVERILQRYYGEDGMADRIMSEYYARRTAEIMGYAALATQVGKYAPLLPGGVPMPGQEVGMDVGGVVTGPATVRVGAGVVEAFAPIGHVGGGSMDVSWAGGPIPISGLESASSADVSKIARELAVSLTQKIRVRRRN